METLLVVAILGLISALVVTDFAAMATRAGTPTAAETLRLAVSNAHHDSGAERVTLRYDEHRSLLTVEGLRECRTYPINARVTFMGESSENPLLKELVFTPEGDATPSRIILEHPSGKKAVYQLEPFSRAIAECAP